MFKVIEIVDGDTFKVSPRWQSGNVVGDTVRPTGYNTPERGERGYEEAAEKLERLILGKEVSLGCAKNFDHGRIVCDVTYNGKNLADYFPEYRA